MISIPEDEPTGMATPVQARVKSTEELGWQAFYRPKGSQGFPSSLPTTNPGSAGIRVPQAQDTLAIAARPRHLGAYTDGEPAHLDETAKALQAIARTLTGKDEAAGQERGKLSSVGKTEERMTFLLRGCDKLTVPVGNSTVGKELYHALKSTATQGRPQLRSIQFPVNINNRIAFGLASLSFGGQRYQGFARSLPLSSRLSADLRGGLRQICGHDRPEAGEATKAPSIIGAVVPQCFEAGLGVQLCDGDRALWCHRVGGHASPKAGRGTFLYVAGQRGCSTYGRNYGPGFWRRFENWIGSSAEL